MDIQTVGAIIAVLLVGGIITGVATQFIWENFKHMTPEQQQQFLREVQENSTFV